MPADKIRPSCRNVRRHSDNLGVNRNEMKKYAFILLLLLSSKLFSQMNTLGFFERKWSSHSSLEFFTDSTFLENYLWFSCGLYKSAMPDKQLRGTWSIVGDTLNMKYYDNQNESSFNLYKYFIFDNANYLIPFGFSNAPDLYYYKTKEYDSKGLEINPADIIVEYDSIQQRGNEIAEIEIRENLIKWFTFQNGKTTSDLLINDDELFNATQSSLIKDLFMIGQIKYSLINGRNKFNVFNINLHGLYYLIDYCGKHPDIIKEDIQMERMMLLREKRKLRKWLKMKANAA